MRDRLGGKWGVIQHLYRDGPAVESQAYFMAALLKISEIRKIYNRISYGIK